MGDISIIARRLPDKSIEYGWSGNGGYFRSVGYLALTYQDDEDVERLFELGELRNLGIPGSEHFHGYGWSTVPADYPMNRDASERWMFSKIAFIDYGYFRELDGEWYYVIPGPFRVKIPLFLIRNNLDDDAFEFAYLSTVEQKIGEFIFNEYLDIDSVFRAYLSDLSVNVEKVKKAILDSDDPLYELYEHYKNIFNYFDDWIVVDCDENYQKITNIYMNPKAPETERMETCDWYTPNKKNRPDTDHIVFTINYNFVRLCLKEIREGKLPNDDRELASREMLICQMVDNGELDELKKEADEKGLKGEQTERYIYRSMAELIEIYEDILYLCLKGNLKIEQIMQILGSIRKIPKDYIIKFASESRLKVSE